MSIDTEDPPRGGEPDPIDGAGAVVVPIVVLFVIALVAAVLQWACW